MTFETARFGNVDVEDTAVMTMTEGLYGFPHLHRFVVIQHKEGSPYRWLQSVDDPAIAFLVIDPWEFKPDYALTVSDTDAEVLNLTEETPKIVYTIVTIPPGNPQAMTVNLAGPVVVNLEDQMGRQIVVDSDEYHTRHSVLEEMQMSSVKAAAH
ncbi:MAG: flagellar assembly protein FliW [bacterium]|jgi:flagellar assembly factor FliW